MTEDVLAATQHLLLAVELALSEDNVICLF